VTAKGGTGVPAAGFPYRQVTVQSIHETRAQVVDRYGAHIGLSTLYRRGGGPFPRVGETWIIDRALGFWTFSALVTKSPPIVTASTVGVPALTELLSALHDAGLILNRSNTEETSDYIDAWAGGAVQYRKIASGLVLLRGSGTGSLLTLPVGFRPTQGMTFAAVSSTPITVDSTPDTRGDTHTNTVKPLQPLATYAVTVSAAGAVSTSAPVPVSVDGIAFLGEQ
jgi:hypothetical protein